MTEATTPATDTRSAELKDAHTPAESPLAKPEPALVVFGPGTDAKPRAAWFPTPDVTLATKAAATMGLRALALCDDTQRSLAASLPQGRVFTSGRAFVPFVAKALYARLDALAGPDLAADPKPPPEPQDASLVRGAPAGEADTGSKAPATSDPRYPRSWAGVAVGSLVLISEGEQDGWYEAKVTEAKGGGLYTLRWRDWPEPPLLERFRFNRDRILLRRRSLRTRRV